MFPFFPVVFNIENVSESVKDHFNLSDSVEQLKEYLSQKFENKSDTLILSLNGEQYIYVHVYIYYDFR